MNLANIHLKALDFIRIYLLQMNIFLIVIQMLDIIRR